jgi:hypothetical protein
MSFFTPFARATRGVAAGVSAIVASVGSYRREEEGTWRLFVERSSAWNRLLMQQTRGTGVAVAYRAVFCHQKPRVTFPMPGSPTTRRELGDALLVYSFQDRARAIRRTALLLQAKRTSLPVQAAAQQICTNEPGQWHLYTSWPAFTHSLDATGRQPRKFGPNGRPLSRARHLLLRDSGPTLIGADAGVPTSTRGATAGFQDARCIGEIVESCLAGGVAQRVPEDLSDPIALSQTGASDWSVVVASICRHVACANAGAFANPSNPAVLRGGGRLLTFAARVGASPPQADVVSETQVPESPFSVVSIALGTDPDTVERLADDVVRPPGTEPVGLG